MSRRKVVDGGPPASEKQKAAMARGRAKRDENIQIRKETGASAKKRLKMLVKGEITVRDLDTSELKRGRVHDGNGSFQGGQMRIPPRVQDQMHAEYIRRTTALINKYGMKAAKLIINSMDDPEVDDRIKHDARKYVLERFIGKVPDIVHVGAETEFDRLQQGAVFEYERSEDSVTGDDESGDEDEQE